MSKQNQQPATPANAQLPMEISVRIHSVRTGGAVLANASVDLNSCFAIRGVKVLNGSNGPFVAMPSYKSGDGYKDICFPCTSSSQAPYPSLRRERQSSLIPLLLLSGADPLRWALPRLRFRQEFNDAVMDAYQQELAQLCQRGQPAQEPSGFEMTM